MSEGTADLETEINEASSPYMKKYSGTEAQSPIMRKNSLINIEMSPGQMDQKELEKEIA